MSGNAMSLKARIKNFANKKDMSAQVVLQNYMFERFLDRLSKSEYKDKFILKGGVLIAALVGISNRATMDMDATIKNYPLNVESLTKAINEICNMSVDDKVFFLLSSIQAIRKDDAYGGYRVSIISEYDKIKIPLQIDITTGDVITPKEVLFQFKKLFEDGSINILAYNTETVMAEKVETILRRGEFNTRPRDFYDLYILTKTQNIEQSVFEDALRSTALNRETSHIFNNVNIRINEIEKSESLKLRWMKYTREYKYANGIIYEDVMDILKALMRNR